MFTFTGKKIADIVLELPDNIAVDCHEYNIIREDQFIAKVYGGRKFTFLMFENNLIRIDRIEGFFSPATYTLSNHHTNSYLGEFKFSRNQKEGTLSLLDGNIFFFHTDTSRKVFYKPSTWNQVRYEMTNSSDKIILSGKFIGSTISEGEIETTNTELILPMLVGIYLIEEKARIQFDNF